MAIPISKLVNITPRVIKAGSAELEIVGLLLTDNAATPFPGLQGFSSKEAVAEYYGMDSAEYLAAAKYFLGFDNSFKKPSLLYFSRLVNADIAGALFGGEALPLASLKQITAGGFAITVDGAAVTVTGLDFSAATTMSDVSAAIAAKVTGTTVTYNTSTKAFTITSKTTGAASSVSVATAGVDVAALNTDTATALGITAATGAIVSDGSAQLTPAENMQSIVSVSQNWVSFTTLAEASDDDIIAFAQWNNDQGVKYFYVPWSTSKALATSAEGTLVAKLKALNLEGFSLQYAVDVYTAVFVMSVAASIDWNRANGVTSWVPRTQTGLAASVTDDTTATALLANNVNFYGRYAARSSEFVFYYDAKMFSGNYGFIDAYINMIWLQNVMQLSLVNGMMGTNRTPYTEVGYTMIRAWLIDPMSRALTNGVVDAGVTLSESQKAELYHEAGEDISTELYTNGYVIRVSDPGAQARVNRDSPIISVWFTYGGSVNRLDVPLTVIL